MDKEIRALLHDDIVKEACYKYELRIDELTFIGGFQNFVYEFQRNNQSFILRLTHSSLRSLEILEAELEWILYLADNGLSVSKPIVSNEGNLYEVINQDNSCFMVTCFEKAIGTRVYYPDCLDDIELFETCGILTGQMHQLARKYKPRTTRHDWQENYYLKNAIKYIPSTQRLVLDNVNDLISTIRDLGHEPDSYGIIHGDINVGNFLSDHGNLMLFDFDECQYSWFVEDIAIQLYYMVYVYGDDSLKERTLQCERFMEHFMNGYLQTSFISDFWIQQIPLFLRLREIIIYIGMYRSLDMSNLDAWSRDYLEQSKVRIEKGLSIIEGYF